MINIKLLSGYNNLKGKNIMDYDNENFFISRSNRKSSKNFNGRMFYKNNYENILKTEF